MFTKSTKDMIIVTLVCFTSMRLNAQIPLKQNASSLTELMPSRVSYLFKWPDENIISGPNRVSEKTSSLIAFVQTDCNEWIRKVLNPAWLPSEQNYLKDNLIMIRNETDQLDVCHIRWNVNDYEVQISLSACIMAIKLTPRKNVNLGTTPNEKIIFTKKLCGQIFNDTAYRRGKYDPNKLEITKIPVKNISSKITDYSFRTNLIRHFSDGVFGEPVDQEMEGVQSPWDGSEADIQNRPDNPDWDKTASSWGYWWRHVCWWNNGKSVGFFLLKKESGPFALEYNSILDNFWFEGIEFKPGGTLGSKQ